MTKPPGDRDNKTASQPLQSKAGSDDSPQNLEVPAYGTRPFFEFWGSTSDLANMVEYIFFLMQTMPKLAAAYREGANLEGANLEFPKNEQRRYLGILLELGLTRSVNSYLTYVTNILTSIFIAKPETLRSERQIALSSILEHESMEELIHALAEDQVHKLAFRGLRDLTKDINRRTGLSLFPNEEQLTKAIEIIEVRNLVVHNNGLVNRAFARKLPQYTSQIGQTVDFPQHTLDVLPLFVPAAAEFDRSASHKFNLPTITADEYFGPNG